jgi:hypothetical protein
MNTLKLILITSCLLSLSTQSYTTPFDLEDYAGYIAGSAATGAGLGLLINDIKNKGEGTYNTSNPEKAAQVGAILGGVSGGWAALILWLGCDGNGGTKTAKSLMTFCSIAWVMAGLFYFDAQTPDSTAGKQNEWWHLVLGGMAGGLGVTTGGAVAAALCHALLVRLGYRKAT